MKTRTVLVIGSALIALCGCAIGGESLDTACTRLALDFPDSEGTSYYQSDVSAFLPELRGTRTGSGQLNALIGALADRGDAMLQEGTYESWVAWHDAAQEMFDKCTDLRRG